MPTASEFMSMLSKIFKEAQEKGLEYIDVVSGDLHGLVGGYPGQNHRMPVCCGVMYQTMKDEDKVLYAPPKKKGATVRIRYKLPRSQYTSTQSPPPSVQANLSESVSIGKQDEIVWKDLHRKLEILPKYSSPSNNFSENGIYFFYEKGEKCHFDGSDHDRIGRVGTHRTDGAFGSRIKNHYSGNKNSSVFRKHIGSALILKHKLNFDLNQWVKQDTPTFDEVELMVSKYIQDNFYFRYIIVETKQKRLELEERLIATLCNANLRPSDNWLGRFAYADKIKASGLWNIQHVDSNAVLALSDLPISENNIKKESVNEDLKPRKKILVATACGDEKNPGPCRAVELYKSTRIKAVYNRRNGCDMAILSAKYGLVDSETIIENYQGILTPERAKEFLLQVTKYVQNYDEVIFFKAGARALYNDLMVEACQRVGVPYYSFGSKRMAGIRELEDLICQVRLFTEK